MFNSTMLEQEFRAPSLPFPITIVCSQSPHSKALLKKYYPKVNESIIGNFYGYGVDLSKKMNWSRGSYIELFNRSVIVQNGKINISS